MRELRPYIGYIVLILLGLLLIVLIPNIKSCAEKKAADFSNEIRGKNKQE